MPATVKLIEIVEALESANDFSSSYVDTETGAVCLVTEGDKFVLEHDTPAEDVPQWQRESIEIARKIREDGDGMGTRYLALPSKFQIHEWAIMDGFALSIDDRRISDDLYDGIRGAGAFRMFKRLLNEYGLWDAWNRYREAEIRQMAVDWCEKHGIPYRER
ncbi:MAG: UPF0158 family protein [Terriglobia bacterium]